MSELTWNLPDLPPLKTRNIEGLPPIPLNNEQWKEWYPQVEAHRAEITVKTTEKWSGLMAAREEEVRRVKMDGRYWLNVYGAIYEAKDEEQYEEGEEWTDDSRSTGWILPFIMFPFQMYAWDFQTKAMRTKGNKGDTLYIKSRQMGMSNILAGFHSHSWMTRRVFQGRLLSRKEDLVDETNNPDSLFWKIKLQLSAQPKWMLQAFAPGFDWRHDYMQASLTNPANFNHLAGESTNATAGRGGTATNILLDEFAFMRGGHGIWTATRAATNHRSAVTTVEMRFGTHAYDLTQLPDDDAPAIMYIPYWLHPFHDEAWLAQERKRDTEAGIQQEVLMNWFGDESEFVYPQLGGKELGDYPYTPFAGPTFVAFDDGYRNKWAFWIIQYMEKTGRHRILDYYENSQHPVDFYGSLWRGIKIDGFHYGDDEEQIMAIMRYIQQPIYVGDTHGQNVELVAGMSTIQRLASRWGIFVNVDFMKRSYGDRQEFTARHIPNTEWNTTPRTVLGLTRVKTFKWSTPPENVERTTWIKEPVKNASADAATAMEYYFVNFESFLPIYSGQKFSYE